MKAFKFALVLVVSFASVAMARPSTWLMTCEQTFRMVEDHPGIVMNYGYSPKAGYLYKKYFPNNIHCIPRRGNPGWVKATVKTNDNDRCFIGYTCSNGYNGPFSEFETESEYDESAR